MSDTTIFAYLTTAALLFPSVAAAQDELAENFRNPPNSARPGVYWYFMDGNMSREGMTADLESMDKAGIGHLVFLEVNVGVARGSVDFLSEEWQELFTHAVREAERLGIEITLGSGPGWAGSGGPWVSAEQSMQHLVASAVDVTGPVSFHEVLPRPEPRQPYFDGALTGELTAAREAFYSDVAVLAFPTTTDGQRIADVDEKSLYYRAPYTSVPGVKPYLPAPADYRDVPATAVIDPQSVVDLSGKLQRDGRLSWDVPAGNWTIMRFGRRNNGATTRPAPQPGLGFECDKFDSAALDAHFDSYIGKLLAKVGPRQEGRGLTTLHIDSWEMGAQNWTAEFAAEFRRRRGYDLLPLLPTYTGRIVGSLELSERFLWDVRLTAQELVIENHAGRLKQLGRQYGLGLSIEPYDMNPTSDLDLGAVADVPMCEFWSDGFGFDSSFSCIEATSIAHTNGRRVVAAEAFTADGREAWKLYPAAVKNQGDWAFCAGINRFVYHTFAHKPQGRRPGMTMGPYGVHWDRGQTWWPMVLAYHRYIARCQFMLRQGQTVADVCYLIPEGAPHVFRPPPSALIGHGSMRDRRGYNFDGCSPNTLIAHASTQDGQVVFPGGASYRLLVLPTWETMTPKLLRKIAALADSGATLVGPPPRKSPSLVDYPRCDQQVMSLSADLWGQLQTPADVIERKVGRGRVIWGGDLQAGSSGPLPSTQFEATDGLTRGSNEEDRGGPPHLYPDYEATARLMAQMDVPPDFETDGPVRYTHRRWGALDIYFVANREAEVVETDCTFRVAGRQPELWDPLNGTIRNLPRYTEQDGRTTVPIRFEAHQSFFVVFRRDAPSARTPVSTGKNFAASRTLTEIEGPWQVAFDPDLFISAPSMVLGEQREAEDSRSPVGRPGPWVAQPSIAGPEAVTFVDLTDWSRRTEPGIKHYSGIATYRVVFDLPESVRPDDHSLRLDLGVVHAMAHVRLNGQDLGVVWCAPWTVDIAHAVRQKENRLEIDVANLWPNRLIGDKALPAESRVTWTTFNPYKADSPLLPSGLLGPVTFKTATAD